MKLLLLDANVLLALAWPNHPFHQRAVARLTRRETSPMGHLPADSSCFRPTLQQSSNHSWREVSCRSWRDARQLIDDPDHVFLEARSKQLARVQELLAPMSRTQPSK